MKKTRRARRPTAGQVRRAERETAYHEAGHAVVAVALCMPIESVTLVPNYELLEAGSVVLSGRWVASLEWASD